jgi:hypothetical protein
MFDALCDVKSDLLICTNNVNIASVPFLGVPMYKLNSRSIVTTRSNITFYRAQFLHHT